jgi:hypothetical protein
MIFALMDLRGLFKRFLPGWTLLNLVLTVISVVSAIILYITKNLFPSTQGILQFTVVSLVNTVFIVYWTFWFILAGPPILGALYFSRTESDYYRYAVQNVAAIIILFIVKIIFNFDILTMAG